MTLSLDRQNSYRALYRSHRPSWQPATEVYESLIKRRLTPDSCLLDLGCGRGGVIEQLSGMVAHPVGFDPDLDSLREHRLLYLPRAVAFAEHLPLRAESIDLVVCSWVLEHLPDPLSVFIEVRRVLRRGGSFIFLTPNALSLVALLNRALRPLQHRLVSRLYGRAEADTFPVHYRANTRSQILRLARQAGLHCELIHLIEDPSYLAFNPLLFGASSLLAQITPPVHLIGVLTA